MKVVKFILFVLCIFIAFVLGSQNPQLVQVNYLIASATMPLAALMSVCFIVGLVLGCFVSFRLFSKLKWQNYRLQKRNEQLSRSAQEQSQSTALASVKDN
ncbi:lipopolysaccharide assembly protein LapA domain-containing protein [Pseudoalteromonas sp. T1lg10]|uniref:lipopolysaccharide assembly protein LapA domain-containing protein n=1 Tax=Pseudoalteromonas sp. T1lg10 TaxID=2077093 RepID=UPI000CF641F1|nr:LapA family protein [Pseudoalteromonas sp. T1lg10]